MELWQEIKQGEVYNKIGKQQVFVCKIGRNNDTCIPYNPEMKQEPLETIKASKINQFNYSCTVTQV